jgi:hypothetical protein
VELAMLQSTSPARAITPRETIAIGELLMPPIYPAWRSEPSVKKRAALDPTPAPRP